MLTHCLLLFEGRDVEKSFSVWMFRFKIQVAFAKGEAIRLGQPAVEFHRRLEVGCQLRERSRLARSRREGRNSAQFQGSKAEGEHRRTLRLIYQLDSINLFHLFQKGEVFVVIQFQLKLIKKIAVFGSKDHVHRCLL